MNCNRLKFLLPVLSLLLIAGCAPKEALTTRVPDAPAQTRSPEPEATPNAVSTEEVYTFVEQMPEYPGGQQALLEFLKNNIKYPAEAKTNKEEGRVMLQFAVMKDGSITNAKVVRGVSEAIDKEALRVASIMPRWRPGKQNGQPVNVRYVLPVVFALD